MQCDTTSCTNAAVSDERTRLVSSTVSAVLFREILKPLAAGLGPVAEVAIDGVADRLFVKPAS
jgi:hypothetical protein